MIIELLESGTVLVSLGTDDMSLYKLDFSDSSDPAAIKKGLVKVLGRVREKRGRTRCESYLIEAFPSKSGCLLIITVHTAEHKRRVYRVKRPGDVACIFDSVDSMLDCMLSGHIPKNSELYEFNGSYVLLTRADHKSTAILSEYGVFARIGGSVVSRLKEYGRRLDYPR